jgi:hypothetical protein
MIAFWPQLEPHIEKLKALKAEYTALTGIDLDAKAKADSKKEKGTPTNNGKMPRILLAT